MLKIFKRRRHEINESNQFQHLPGVYYSKELSDKDKNFIKSMNGYNNSAQTPMLVDKICVLTNEIKNLNTATTIFSTALVIFAIIQIIISLNN
ncbi:MAG: hypothetical protein WC545_03965 [Patescibacteria group bacterium]